MELSGLNFRPGIGVQDVIKSKFGCFVSPIDQRCAFFLVASFGRCKFKLCPATVGLLLQATLGGLAEDFDVVHLSVRVFRFSVSSRLVGFHVLKLRSFECSSFKIFFHLWSNGGPQWVREWKMFCAEEESSWTTVRNSSADHNTNFIRPSTSFADAVRGNPLTGANAIPVQTRQQKKVCFIVCFFRTVNLQWLSIYQGEGNPGFALDACQKVIEGGHAKRLFAVSFAGVGDMLL